MEQLKGSEPERREYPNPPKYRLADPSMAPQTAEDWIGLELIEGSSQLLAECVLCEEQTGDNVQLPCFHGGVCAECLGEIEECPFCEEVLLTDGRLSNGVSRCCSRARQGRHEGCPVSR